jgi:hypothetical protein
MLKSVMLPSYSQHAAESGVHTYAHDTHARAHEAFAHAHVAKENRPAPAQATATSSAPLLRGK